MSTMIVALSECVRARVIDTEDVAHVAGATRRTVRRWLSSTATPRRHAEGRLLELMTVVEVLRLALRDESARRWLRTPNPALDWHKPLELIAQGEYRSVTASILAMAEGVAA